MVCPFCGNTAADGAMICPVCGRLLERNEVREEGVMAIRQGRRAQEAYAQGRSPIPSENTENRPSAPDTPEMPRYAGVPVIRDETFYGLDEMPLRPGRGDSAGIDRPVYGDMTGSMYPLMPKTWTRAERRRMSRHPANWWKISIAAVVLLMFMGIGVLVFLNRTDMGQRILARMGRDATSMAYWEIGEERMDVGDVDRAILAFERAKAIEEAEAEENTAEQNFNVSGLLMLASTYESTGRIADAEAIYTSLYTDIVPTATEPYANEIRILEASNRLAEAAQLMMTAYQNTGQTSFRTQRNELLPRAPETNVYAGLYEEKKYITLTSAEGFDIYYTFDPQASLPEEGELFEKDIFLDEGIYTMRAVAVNGQLVSDELSAVYRIIMPSPQTPRASLAPNTYKQRQRVRLWPGEENMNDDDITIYYTIDGSLPDADSPIYTGEPIALPGNYSDLHAVAVNRYGKASNTLSIRYKVLAKPYPLNSYSVTDIGSNLTLCQTTWDKFREVYGEALEMEETHLGGMMETCQKRIYSWGYATFYIQSGRQLLGEVYCTTSLIHGPRGTDVGNTEDEVVGKFRDMGQVVSPSGNRGLYENESGKGAIYVQPDGGKIIRYTANTADSHKWQLTYTLSASGTVTAIDLLYIP